MEINELAGILSNVYHNAPKGETYIMLYLFGIKYSKEIRELGTEAVVKQSEIPIAYKSEIAKAINLAQYVDLNENGLKRINYYSSLNSSKFTVVL